MGKTKVRKKKRRTELMTDALEAFGERPNISIDKAIEYGWFDLSALHDSLKEQLKLVETLIALRRAETDWHASSNPDPRGNI